MGIRQRIESLTRPSNSNIEEGDHERFAHYADKAKITESAVTGKAIRALCGKKWIPTRNPENFPVCPTCKEIYNRLKQ
ncbi:MAG: DUF3039 domain-containing protein [Actinobacteria bacterium]|jgi:hypothetical protein|nr:DUF3039 domain-containing protein [Actinomycetota bacterium]